MSTTENTENIVMSLPVLTDNGVRLITVEQAEGRGWTGFIVREDGETMTKDMQGAVPAIFVASHQAFGFALNQAGWNVNIISPSHLTST